MTTHVKRYILPLFLTNFLGEFTMASSKCNENYIREAAYYLWQNAGCPMGQDEKFWSMAVEQMSACKCTKTACKKSTSTAKKSTSTAKKSSK